MYKVQGYSSSPTCFLCKRAGHKAADCRVGFTQGATQYAVCQACNKKRHRTEECRSRSHDKVACMVCPRATALPKQKEALPKQKDKKVQVELVAEHNEVPATDTDPQIPVVCGEIKGQRVSVLRDSGSNTVMVRRSLVRDEDLTGDTSVIIMVDHTEKWLPEAEIEVCTPYYWGKLKAKRMEDPLYALILGNIPGVRKVSSPDFNWKPLKLELEI
ncbi:hypothetical protein HPB48_012797 [Haemaphysalis longicornis]|uniref:CCHC-type domain-containing protein n=1 Tax=Haemaphysalis longicornis TaxID=44386 RepID=A0A9J6FZ87_HAELO|nr:hypothetical protein HPB48_012797 [Haemaphysalis longicornis]